MGLIDELSHALVARYRKEIDPAVLSDGLRWLSSQFTPQQVDRLLLEFTEQFPNVAVFRGELTAQQWLAGAREGLSNREAALEELMLLWLANSNPAFQPFKILFEDSPLRPEPPTTTPRPCCLSSLPSALPSRPGSAVCLRCCARPCLPRRTR